MKTTFFSLVFILFFAINSNAQKGLDPTADEISQAKKLRENYLYKDEFGPSNR